MTQNLNARLALFASNTQSVKKNFVWQNTLIKRLAALLYAAEGKTADCEAIRECHNLIKENTGVFSIFRGNLSICVAAMLSLETGRERLFQNTLEVYGMMKESGFRASDYLAIAAFQVAVHSPEAEYRQVIARSKAFYQGMKSHHWFYTSQDDYIFSVLLGLSDIDSGSGAEHIERLFKRLKPEFWSGNAVQALAQILVLSGDPDKTAERVLLLRDAFRQRGLRLDREYTLSSLGVLALLPAETDNIVSAVSDAYETLRAQRGFGAWSVSKQELLLLSAGLVAFSYAGDIKNGLLSANLSTNIASIIIAQQTAIMIVAVSSASTAAASSSN